MKVLKIEHDTDRYQYFMPVDDKDALVFGIWDGSPRLATWSPPPVFIYEPKHKKTNFYYPSNGGLVADRKATDALRELFEKAGELLPLHYNGELYYVLNVTTVLDCLDEAQSEWESYGLLKRYAFNPACLSAASSAIFKIPQMVRTALFVVEGLATAEREFSQVIRREGLKGLTLTEVWSSDKLEL